MKTRKMTPRNVAPVKRENVATVSRDGNTIAPQESWWSDEDFDIWLKEVLPETAPFAGDDAE